MYKIYNNEIKITNNLKGGVSLAGTNTNLLSLIHQSKKDIFDTDPKKFDTDTLEKEDLKHLVPLNGYAIDFENYDSYMKDAIEGDVARLKDVLITNNKIFDSGKLKSNEKLNKNILKYAMSFAKEMELFENGKLLTVSEYKNKFADASAFPATTSNKKTFVKTTIDEIFNDLVPKIKILMEKYPETTSGCKNMYAKIKKTHKLPHWVGFGGGYDSLNYCLNGGTLSTLIRVPNLTNYFKSQLSVVEARLRNSNKTLSAVTKTQIQTVIDQLEKHEVFLKDTFELLKNSHLIDENKVDMTLHKDKLEKAKVSLRKHGRHSNTK
jgi:hypothetical protein